jgi:hypothetical protein
VVHDSMTLLKSDGMLVMSESSLGRALIKNEVDRQRLCMTTRENQPTSVLVPYEIWFQIQHFVATVISRDQN